MKMSAFPATPEWKKHGSWPPMWRRRHQVNNKSHDTCTPYSCSKKNLGSGKDKDKLRWLLRTHYVWEMEMVENRTVGGDLKKKKKDSHFPFQTRSQTRQTSILGRLETSKFQCSHHILQMRSHLPLKYRSYEWWVMTVEVNTLNN